MLELHQEVDGKILTVKLSGKLTKEDYGRFVPEVERAITQHGKIRVLCQMHDFHGWQLGARWEDIKFDVKHFADIERLAMVGDRKWEHGMAVFCKPFTTAKIRYFDEKEADQAAEWIHAETPHYQRAPGTLVPFTADATAPRVGCRKCPAKGQRQETAKLLLRPAEAVIGGLLTVFRYQPHGRIK